MHLRHLSIGLAVALTLSAFALAATVYKWTDSNGVVHYSDQPEPGAERIVTQSGSDAPRAKSYAAPAPYKGNGKPSDERQSTLDYTAFSIDAPMPEQNFTDMTVAVRLHLEPQLRQGHVIDLYLDGKLEDNQPHNATEFTLMDVPRGAHTVFAKLTDPDSGDSRNTDAVTFYVQRPSLLAPLRKKK